MGTDGEATKIENLGYFFKFIVLFLLSMCVFEHTHTHNIETDLKLPELGQMINKVELHSGLSLQKQISSIYYYSTS